MDSSTTPPPNGSSLELQHSSELEEGEKLGTTEDHKSPEPGSKESKCSNDLDSSSSRRLEGTDDSSDQALREATQQGEFLGDDDPEDPLNWPFWKKTFHSLIVSFYCLCV